MGRLPHDRRTSPTARVRLQSTAGHDVTARGRSSARSPPSVNASDAILDGELVVFDDDGHPSFELVQNSGVGSRREAVLQLFDVLAVDGTDTIDLPYEDRRRLLEQLVEPGPNWMVPAHRVGDGDGAARGHPRAGARGRDGQAARLDLPTGQAHQGLAQGQEPPPGRVDHRRLHRRRRQPLRRRSARCSSGGRSTAPTRCTFAGGVGTGFNHATLEALTARLRRLRTDECPFDPPPPDRVPPRRDVGRAGPHGDRRDRRVHQRGPRPPRQLHRADADAIDCRRSGTGVHAI